MWTYTQTLELHFFCSFSSLFMSLAPILEILCNIVYRRHKNANQRSTFSRKEQYFTKGWAGVHHLTTNVAGTVTKQF